MLRNSFCALSLAMCGLFNVMPSVANDDPVHMLFEQKTLPCPNGWTVEPNPSMDDSLSYLTDDGELAVSVSLIKQGEGMSLDSERYARVAAEQMGCSIPVQSNIIERAWSFTCNDFKIEGVVYGGEGDLVLLGISGRNEKTEPQLLNFVRFLASQAGAK